MLRRFGKVIRGSASLPQIVTAGALGGMLGFVPGFFLPGDLGGGLMQAPGLILAIFALVLVLDANLAVFGLVTLAAKLLSFVLLPLSFAVGRFLLEGPTQGLFAWLVNAPITAWFGLERYATSGGALVGLVFGVVVGVVIFRMLHALRTKLADLEEGSERYRSVTSKRSVRLLGWLFLGGSGKGKRSWREVIERERKGKFVRVLGLAVVAVLAVGLWLTQNSFGGAWLRAQAETGLTHWNGATVDVGGATLDLGGGHVAFEAVGMTDPGRLENDHFRARTVELDMSTSSLLAGRMVIDRLASGEAKSGVQRETPGVRVEVEPEPPAPPPADAPGRSIDDYLQDVETWRERLDLAVEWIERLTGGGETPADETAEDRDARVERETDVLGYAYVVATHLITERPSVTIRDLAIDGLEIVGSGNDLVDIQGVNLSSQPALADGPMTLSVTSRAGTFAAGLRYDPAERDKTSVTFEWKAISVDALASSLTDAPIRGGTVDLRFDGSLDLSHADGVGIELPLIATLRGTTLTVGGQSAPLDGIDIPIGLTGSLRNPKVAIDGNALADALVAAGRAEIANQVRARADDLLGGVAGGLGDALGGVVDGQKTPEQLLEEAKKKAAEEAKKKTAEELKKRLPGGLSDIFKKDK